MTTTVSVVMTTYQGARYIDEQVASIIAQSVRPTEVVIADDGSTDGTPARARALLDAAGIAVTLIEAEAGAEAEAESAPLGVVANLERGLRRARGDVIALADQDDRWLEHRLLHTLAELDRHPQCDGLVADGHLIDGDGTRLAGSIWTGGRPGRRRRAAIAADPLAETLRDNFACGATMAIRRAALDAVVPLDRHGLHDAWIALVLGATDRLAVTTEKVIDYRLHDANTVGLARASLADRRGRPGVRARRIASLRAARERAAALGAGAPALAAIDAQIEFEELRRTVPGSTLPRGLAVARALVAGSYHRHARGWRSAAFDLIDGPEEAAAARSAPDAVAPVSTD